jgi:hypothetical protein
MSKKPDHIKKDRILAQKITRLIKLSKENENNTMPKKR